MTTLAKSKQATKVARTRRVRSRIIGTADRPRAAVYRTLRHIGVQFIDDSNGTTLAAATDNDITAKGKNKTEVATLVGTAAAKKAQAAGITTVVFDRRGSAYHGRVKALAEALRAGGLEF